MVAQSLPNDILLPILQHVRRGTTASGFLCCVRVSKQWSDVAHAVLYRRVVLRNDTILKFSNLINIPNARLVKFLTLSISQIRVHITLEGGASYIWENGSSATQALWADLRLLASKMDMFSELESLSISCDPYHLGFWLPRSLLADFIKALPQSCENLEIDTQDAAEKGEKTGRGDLLCAAIYATLPRLRHLRLHLSVLCRCSLGNNIYLERKGDDPDPENARKVSEPPVYPNLQTLIINCSIGSKDHTGLCMSDIAPAPPCNDNRPQAPPKACIPLANAIRDLYTSQPSAFPSAKQLLVVDEHHRRYHDLSIRSHEWNSVIIRDILAFKTRHVPYTKHSIAGLLRTKTMARIGSNPPHDIMGDKSIIPEVAEGGHWVSLKDGTRLPRAYLSRTAEGLSELEIDAVKPVLLSREEWLQHNPIGMQIWALELESGVECLSDNLEQDGIGDCEPVTTIVPVGWRRSDMGKYERIEQS